MSLLDFTINTSTCTRCGECIADCPARIITPLQAGALFSPHGAARAGKHS